MSVLGWGVLAVALVLGCIIAGLAYASFEFRKFGYCLDPQCAMPAKGGSYLGHDYCAVHLNWIHHQIAKGRGELVAPREGPQ